MKFRMFLNDGMIGPPSNSAEIEAKDLQSAFIKWYKQELMEGKLDLDDEDDKATAECQARYIELAEGDWTTMVMSDRDEVVHIITHPEWDMYNDHSIVYAVVL